jgi:tryptophanyl-tRNA synthetase
VRILSGIQPTGDKHLGNYFGAIRRWAEQQDEAECFYPIVDLHALTTPQEPDDLRRATLDLAALLVASGIDPERSALFVQSHVPEHPRLAWLLECMTPYGDLRRMPQYREKSERQTSFGVGLLTYPVLQAADILLYQPDSVPVGEDQRQHIELARDVAQRFNNRYGQTFNVPEATVPTIAAKVMDLQDPSSRMSTSAESDAGVVRLLDPPDKLRKKIRSAVTDSGREVLRSPDKPGVTNLVELFSATTGETESEIEARYAESGYGPFKADLADAVVELVTPIQERFSELRGDEAELGAILAKGADKAHAVASVTLAAAHEHLGLVAPIES